MMEVGGRGFLVAVDEVAEELDLDRPLARAFALLLRQRLQSWDAPPPPETAALLTLKEAASRARIGLTALRNLVNDGTIPHIANGRRKLIAPAALEEWIREQATRGAASSRGRADSHLTVKCTSRGTAPRLNLPRCRRNHARGGASGDAE